MDVAATRSTVEDIFESVTIDVCGGTSFFPIHFVWFLAVRRLNFLFIYCAP